MSETDFYPELHTQVRRQNIFAGLVGEDIRPEQLAAQMGPFTHTEDFSKAEQLTEPLRRHDERLHMRKPVEVHKSPRMNRLYGSLKSPDSWKYVIDNFAKGTLTTVAGTSVSTTVTLAIAPHYLLSRWPGANQLYLCIRQFSIAPQTATFATAGNLDMEYDDVVGGQRIPLGNILNNSSYNNADMTYLIPTPITDPDNTLAGNLVVLLNAGATTGTYNWQMAFSAVYLIPELHGFDVMQSSPFVEVEDHAPSFVGRS
jgi:hypothetical protein